MVSTSPQSRYGTPRGLPSLCHVDRPDYFSIQPKSGSLYNHQSAWWASALDDLHKGTETSVFFSPLTPTPFDPPQDVTCATVPIVTPFPITPPSPYTTPFQPAQTTLPRVPRKNNRKNKKDKKVHDQKPDVSPNTSIAIDYPITPIHESAAQHQDLTKVQSAEQKRQRLYKTELCRNWEKQNQCQYGDRCQYAHGVCDLRQVERHPKYKTQTCRTFEQTGACPYGIRCTFRHELSSPLTSVALDNLSAHPQTSLPPRRQWVFDSNTVDITLTSEAESLLPQKLLTDLANPPISPSADLWYPMNADLRCIPFF